MGKKRASRGEVTRAIWTYIEDNNLHHPRKYHMIKPDAELKPILGNKMVNMYMVTLILSRHFNF